MNVDIFQGVWRLLKLRVSFQDNVILVELSINGGDLTLAEGVVERVVNIGGQYAKARSGGAIDGEVAEEGAVELVAGNVTKFGKFFQAIDKTRNPVGELFRVNVLQAVLKLRAADAIFD